MIPIGGDMLGGTARAVRVIELRNYRLQAGRTGDFIRYFEEHFLFSQRDHGMHVLGQFAVVDAPDRFVWIRGFEDMDARRRGLSGFYGGPVWQARRAETNAMIRDSDDVHLLRPLGLSAALVGALSLEDRAAAPAGAVPPGEGLVAVDFYRAEPGALSSLIGLFERRVRPALVAEGHRVLGHFVAELTPNDYPRLPVVQDPDLLVVLSAYRDAAHYATLRAGEAGDPVRTALEGGAPAPLPARLTTLRLKPTARSLIRYHQGESGGRPPASPSRTRGRPRRSRTTLLERPEVPGHV
jgi:hypothetical protein